VVVYSERLNRDCQRLYRRRHGADDNVTADVYAFVGNQTYSTDFNDPFSIPSGALGCANVTVSTMSGGDEVAVKVHSRRQNNAYHTYVVP
jgi:hypothetical protein